MDNLQTKKLRPEWIDKLAEAIEKEFDVGMCSQSQLWPLEEKELADFIWQEYQKLMDEYIK